MWQLDLMAGYMWLNTTVPEYQYLMRIASTSSHSGREGNKDGEFNNPYAIAVRDDGSVFVSDTGNYRVQVFN